MTSYKFSQRPLRGFAVGGAIRWQDKAAVGYPVILTRSPGAIVQSPDLAHPFFAPSTWNGLLNAIGPSRNATRKP